MNASDSGHSQKYAKFFLCVLCVFALIFGSGWWFAHPVHAHGGGELQIINAPVADYLVSVSTSPVPLRARTALHVTVSVAAVSDQTPVLDANVLVEIFETGTGRPLASAPATTEQSVNKLFYEADLPPLNAGMVDFIVTIIGAEGEGEVMFRQEVRPFLDTGRLVTFIILALLIIAVGYRTWYINRS
jgi:hypothetical protein